MYSNLTRFIFLVAILCVAPAVNAQILDSTAVGKVKVGGRVNMDGGWYYSHPDFVMGSGTTFSEFRVRATAVLTTRIDFRAEIDFAYGNVSPKDVAARYYVTKDFTLTLGNFREPFSPAAYASSIETYFIGIPTLGQAFGCSRNLGFGARYVKPHFFVEAGVFSQDLLDQIKGSKGYAFTNRILYRPINEGSNILQFGVSNSLRRADANNLDPKDSKVELRTINYGSRAETNVDRQQIISVKNPYAKYQNKTSAEFLGIWNRVALQGEYINAFVKAKSGYENQRYYGYYGQAIAQLRGHGLPYNANDALLARNDVGSITLALRYSYTNLDDSEGYLVGGNYMDAPVNGVANGTFNGGTAKGVSASLSYVPFRSIAFTLEYNWGKLKSITLPGGSLQFLQAQAIVQF